MTATINKQTRALDARALDVLFHDARSANRFGAEPVPAELLEAIVNSAEFGPTAMNALPLRIVFVTSQEGKERLRPLLSAGNVEKMLSAPVTAILARDLEFHEHLPRLFPHAPQAYFDAARNSADEMSLQNATLQAGYFIIAARAYGLDAGPMGGFDHDGVDREFFPDGTRKSMLLVTLGYGDDSKLFPRNPRLDFTEIASFV
ncbi:MAG TPA: malonic semialdehyde reductase [Candidatus Baltobacteraceae bacterium]|nr:malonic semialdehyde reductase [Candidatus Baltobacteraceae bacterium]